jgi:ribonuclease HI
MGRMEEKEMKFLICNIHLFNEDNITENFFDLEVTKELAFNSKVQTRLPNGKKNLSYSLLLIPLVFRDQLSQEEIIMNSALNSKISFGNFDELLISNTLSSIFLGKDFDVEKLNMSIDIIGVTDKTHLDLTYTDGSFKKNSKEASYGVVKILNEDANGLFEEFTEKNYLHKELSGKIPEGTNNIGELTAIKVAIENFDDKRYQVIISDSEYGIKCFREWYYNWKDNGFKNYAKKQISNIDLIKDIFNKMTESGKIVFFKWVKGHSKKTFNELCDELAKDALK